MLKKLTRTINDQSASKGAVLLLAWLCLTTNPGLADERQAVDQALVTRMKVQKKKIMICLTIKWI